eukprot:14116664-Heterocapsa_arctica.AAC.1
MPSDRWRTSPMSSDAMTSGERKPRLLRLRLLHPARPCRPMISAFKSHASDSFTRMAITNNSFFMRSPTCE